MNIDDSIATTCNERLREAFPEMDLVHERTMKLAEESGEAVGAVLRYLNMTRRTGTHSEVAEELADVVICAMTLADALSIDLEGAVIDKSEKVMRRGWRDPR